MICKWSLSACFTQCLDSGLYNINNNNSMTVLMLQQSHYSLPALWVQRAEDDSVHCVMSPEEQPAGRQTVSTCGLLWHHVCKCVWSILVWTLTSSGCQWVWSPVLTLWSGQRWTVAGGPWRALSSWPSELPDVQSVTPVPQSPDTTRYMLHSSTNTWTSVYI